jgi:histidinol phosphatase-like enzyme (inositol monophosphatase family)
MQTRRPDALHRGDLRQYLEFAVEAAQLAGRFTLGYFNAGTPHEMKQDRTPVTAADRGAEERLRARIRKYFPSHGILGEEFGEQAATEPIRDPRGGDDARVGPARWILDPIDGTYSFISGVPLYAVLVGLEWNGEMLLGVIDLPALGETVYAAHGLGCWWNGRRARVSEVAELSEARLLNCGTKALARSGREAGFQRLRDACYADRAWCDAYAYALVATGRAEVVIDPVMSTWDTAALLPCITEAGGRFTDWGGRPTHTAPEAVATNGALHAAVLERLNFAG